MKAVIEYTGLEQNIKELDIPQIPNRGDEISFFVAHDQSWRMFKVLNLDYGFRDGVFENVTVYVIEST